MKKYVVIFLVLSLISSLCGCNHEKEPIDAVQFYYLREEDSYLYGSADGVVTFEDRDPSGHQGDFRYLLTLYLQGPLEDGLESPFPAGCAVTELTRTSTEMTVTLNANFLRLKGMDRTLACVCLARTCFSLANVQKVHIQARDADTEEQIYETITIDSLLLEDNAIASGAGK